MKRPNELEEIIKERDWYCSELARAVTELVDIDKRIDEYNEVENIVCSMFEYSDGSLSIPETIKDNYERLHRVINELVEAETKIDELKTESKKYMLALVDIYDLDITDTWQGEFAEKYLKAIQIAKKALND